MIRTFREIVNLSFASQLNSMIWLAKHGKELKPAVYEFPSELDKETAFAKLETMSISIDKWTKEQETYARAYRHSNLSTNLCSASLDRSGLV
jgi:S-adenosylhomocysteine hydrolase